MLIGAQRKERYSEKICFYYETADSVLELSMEATTERILLEVEEGLLSGLQ